MKDEAVL